MKTKEILQKAINEYGIVDQIGMCHEEIGELLQAINKVSRMRGITHKEILHPSKFSGGETKYSLAYYNLCSEVADVKIMIEQLTLMLDETAINLSY